MSNQLEQFIQALNNAQSKPNETELVIKFIDDGKGLNTIMTAKGYEKSRSFNIAVGVANQLSNQLDHLVHEAMKTMDANIEQCPIVDIERTPNKKEQDDDPQT
ncbi:hypothetical protein [Vibrio jasicida]|uniref:hypothetical protein n=1 Tax=Vibrio jasicida TaxID=766224 RepID=UPI0005ED5264|nr:hypothetical protein [Vibrio jasicida]